MSIELFTPDLPPTQRWLVIRDGEESEVEAPDLAAAVLLVAEDGPFDTVRLIEEPAADGLELEPVDE